MLLMANYNELINMLHKLIFNARSVNFAWFIWGPYAIFGLIFLIDFTCLQSMKEVKTLNKWDISGEFSNTVDYIVIPGGGTDHHIFSSSLIISGVTVNVKLSISIHRDFYESCYKELLRRWVTPRWNLTLKMRPFLTWIFAFQCHFQTLLLPGG